MQRKTILFIPSSYYLSDAAFIHIAKNAKFRSIYLDPKDSAFQSINIKHQEGFDSIFDEYKELSKDLYSGTNIFLRLLSTQLKKIQIIQMIRKIKPSVIVTTSDGTFCSRIIAKLFPKIPFVILQTALITIQADKYKLKKRSLLGSLIARLFGRIFFPFFEPVKPFGLNHPNAVVLLWGDSSRQLLLPHVKSQTLRLVGNTLFESPIKPTFCKNRVLFLAPHTATDLEALDFCEEVRAIACQFLEIKFAVRIHPIMNAGLFRDFFSKAKIENVEVVENSETITESILNSSVVVSQYSAATLDVIALGRYVILYKKIGEQRLSHWFDGMNIPRASSTQGVAEILRKCRSEGFLENPYSHEIPITQHWYNIGEPSRKNVIAEINQILKERINKTN